MHQIKDRIAVTMRTFLKPASPGYGVNKQYYWGMGGSGGDRAGQTESIDQ